MSISHKTHATLLALALGASLLMGTAGCASQTTVVSEDGGITVSSTASVPAEPDVASLDLTVLTQGSSAADANKSNSKAVDSVLACLKDRGVEDKNIQTTYTDVSPNWDDESIYEAHTILTVEGIPIDEVGDTMGACLNAGATEVSGPNYYISNYDEVYQEALVKALEQAKPKAELVAKTTGVRLGQVTSVVEGYQEAGYAFANGNSATAEDEISTLGIVPGELDIEATVTVTYAIN